MAAFVKPELEMVPTIWTGFGPLIALISCVRKGLGKPLISEVEKITLDCLMIKWLKYHF